MTSDLLIYRTIEKKNVKEFLDKILSKYLPQEIIDMIYFHYIVDRHNSLINKNNRNTLFSMNTIYFIYNLEILLEIQKKLYFSEKTNQKKIYQIGQLVIGIFNQDVDSLKYIYDNFDFTKYLSPIVTQQWSYSIFRDLLEETYWGELESL